MQTLETHSPSGTLTALPVEKQLQTWDDEKHSLVKSPGAGNAARQKGGRPRSRLASLQRLLQALRPQACPGLAAGCPPASTRQPHSSAAALQHKTRSRFAAGVLVARAARSRGNACGQPFHRLGGGGPAGCNSVLLRPQVRLEGVVRAQMLHKVVPAAAQDHEKILTREAFRVRAQVLHKVVPAAAQARQDAAVLSLITADTAVLRQSL